MPDPLRSCERTIEANLVNDFETLGGKNRENYRIPFYLTQSKELFYRNFSTTIFSRISTFQDP